MIGLDTNLLLRYILDDDAAHSSKARRVISSLDHQQPAWIPLVSVLEIAWVLYRKKRIPRPLVADILEQLLSRDVFIVEQADTIARAVNRYRSTQAEFADCLVMESARAAGCAKVVTFDRIAARDLGMELLDASTP